MTLRSSVLRSNPGRAESRPNFGACDAPEAAPPPQPASTKLSASAPNSLPFTELGVRPGRSAGLLDLLSLVVHLRASAVQAVAGNAQPHLDEQFGIAERPNPHRIGDPPSPTRGFAPR